MFCKSAVCMVVDVSICAWECDVVVGEGVRCADNVLWTCCNLEVCGGSARIGDTDGVGRKEVEAM